MAGVIVNPHLLTGDLGDVTFFEEDETLRDRQQREHIRRNKILANTKADDERTAAARDHQSVGAGRR